MEYRYIGSLKDYDMIEKFLFNNKAKSMIFDKYSNFRNEWHTSNIMVGAFDNDKIVGVSWGHIVGHTADHKLGYIDDVYVLEEYNKKEIQPQISYMLECKIYDYFKSRQINLIDGEKQHQYEQWRYNTFMDFFDKKIQIKKLKETLGLNDDYQFRGKYSLELIISSFVREYSQYAKDNYNIENLELYIQQKEFYKSCYENYKKYIDKEITTGEYFNNIELLGLDDARESYLSIVFDYAKNVVKMTNDEIKNIRKKGYYTKNVLDLISATSSEKEIFDILTDCGQFKTKGIEFGNKILDNIKKSVGDYVITTYRDTLDKDEYDSIIIDLREKINKVMKIYRNMKKEEMSTKKENTKNEYLKEILKSSITIINNFIASNVSLKNFLLKNNMSRNDFEKALNSVKENDIELYNKYNEYIKQRQSQRYAILMGKNEKIIDYIKNGIINEETNEKRDFDILDYYIYSSLKPEEFLELIKEKYDNNDLRVVRTFFAKNKCEKDELKTIKEMKYTVNSVEITDEQKATILGYLKSINAPYNMRLFRIATRRYLNGELFLNEENQISDSESISENRHSRR